VTLLRLNRSLGCSLGSRLFLWAAIAAVLPGACGRILEVSDPQLQPIREMLDSQLPPGTPSAIVNQFVSARGYSIVPAGKPDTLVVIIRHIDKQKLQPVTARVTFHFDANDKLLTTEIVRTMNQPPPQAETHLPPPSN
jgi:hypothetical protein